MSKDKNTKLNILVVHNFYKINGGEDTVFYNDVDLLKSHGHDVIVYTRSNREIDSFNFFKKLIVPFMYLFNFKTYFDIKNLIRKYNIDIVHIHNNLGLIGGAVYYAAIHCRVPIVQTVHNFRLICPNGLLCRNGKVCEDCIKGGLRNAIKNKCYHNSSLQTFAIVFTLKLQRYCNLYKNVNFICLTEFNKNKLLEIDCINEDKVYIKPNSCPEFNGDFLPYDKRENYYCFVGRLDEYKGIQHLLECVKLSPQIKILICGDGPLRQWCEETIQTYKLNCTLLGQIEQIKVMEIISKSKGVIVPSILYEGLPMIIIESYSTGTPVFGRNIGNITNAIINKKSGLLFDNKVELLEILDSNFNFDSDYIHGLYVNKFSDKANYENMMDVYLKLIKGRDNG